MSCILHDHYLIRAELACAYCYRNMVSKSPSSKKYVLHINQFKNSCWDDYSSFCAAVH
jgi:hypothetical protein